MIQARRPELARAGFPSGKLSCPPPAGRREASTAGLLRSVSWGPGTLADRSGWGNPRRPAAVTTQSGCAGCTTSFGRRARPGRARAPRPAARRCPPGSRARIWDSALGFLGGVLEQSDYWLMERWGTSIGLPWVFVHPWQYRAAVRALVGHQLLASHVIVAESLEHLVEESLSDIGRGVWARSRAELQWPAGGDSDIAEAPALDAHAVRGQFEVRRTFLCEASPPLRPAAAVVFWVACKTPTTGIWSDVERSGREARRMCRCFLKPRHAPT